MQSALSGKKVRNCDYALVFEPTSPKLTGVDPWTLYHILGPPAGCKNTYNYKFLILRVFDNYDSILGVFDDYDFRRKYVGNLAPNI